MFTTLLRNAVVFLISLAIPVVGYYSYKEYGPLVVFAFNQKFQKEKPFIEIEPIIEDPVVVNPFPITIVEVKEEPATPEAKKPPVGRQWISGNHLEWRVPEDTYKIVLKYKEKNGRLILEYDFKVEPGQRIEIIAE